jgi:hypothetical protein
LPVAVLRNRFLVPEWVFIFGIGRLLKQTGCLLSGTPPGEGLQPGRTRAYLGRDR